MYVNLALLSAFVFLYSITAGRLERTPVNGAVVFTAFGVALGPFGLGFLHLAIDAEVMRTLAEVTLALVLFTDASSANLGVLKKSFHIPQRLLLLGLPLTIILGFAAGFVLIGKLTLLEIAVLAVMLAPTDAALGKAVVSDPAVPAPMREGLNVESGLNDGICVPILFVFLAMATDASEGLSGSALAVKLVAEEIGIGAAAGIGVTLLGAWVLRQVAPRGWLTDTWRQLPVIALAISCFAVAQALGGSGFIASFVGGLLFGYLVKRHKHHVLLAAEEVGDTFALITWVAFGSAVVGQSLRFLSWEVVLYSVLSLTLVRMVPVFLVLGGMKLRTDEKLFMGWFGPRGLASVVFAVIVLNSHLPGGSVIGVTAVCTITLSIIAHGLSANPLVASLSKRLGTSNKDTTP